MASLFWPAVVFVIPAGITFAAARVYAEGSVIPSCDAAETVACADAAANQVCSPTHYEGASGRGLCLETGCREGDTVHVARACFAPVRFCADLADECQARALEAPCNQGKGRCRSQACSDVDGGLAVPSSIMLCEEVDASAGVSTGATADASAIPSRSTGDGGRAVDSGASQAAAGGDGGCSTSPDDATAFPLLGAPLSLAIAVLFALRRRKKGAAADPDAKTGLRAA